MGTSPMGAVMMESPIHGMGPTDLCRASPLRPPAAATTPNSPNTPLRASGTPVSKRGRGQESRFVVSDRTMNDQPHKQQQQLRRKRKDRDVERMHENSSDDSDDGHRDDRGDEGADNDGENVRSIFVSKLPEYKLPRLLPGNGEERDEDGRFTLGQVRKIVENAVKTREAELREEYDAILLERLDEQWRTFAKYNEDNVASKMKGSNYDYYC